MTEFGIIGTGYVADFYGQTLPNHANLKLAGVFDLQIERMKAFAERYRCRTYDSLAEMLADPSLTIVANLTNPRSHFAVTREAIEAGKHVYSEKPLGMSFAEAQVLADLAAKKGVRIGGAPCTALSDSFVKMRALIAEGVIGTVRLAYAEMDDGMVHRLRFRHWRNSLGIAWPAADEFEVGCTFEHAGYQLVLLASLFGPAERLTAFATCQVPAKAPDLTRAALAPDFSVGMIEFGGGVVARLTCSVLARENRSLTIIGEDGWITLRDVWDFHSPLAMGRWEAGWVTRAARRLFHYEPRKTIRIRPGGRRHWSSGHRIDFARGIADFALAIEDNAPAAMNADLAVHITELTELLQSSETICGVRPVSSFQAVAPPVQANSLR